MDIVTMRQKARRTPGDSARFTNVELNENVSTTPTTASAPRVLVVKRWPRMSHLPPVADQAESSAAFATCSCGQQRMSRLYRDRTVRHPADSHTRPAPKSLT